MLVAHLRCWVHAHALPLLGKNAWIKELGDWLDQSHEIASVRLEVLHNARKNMWN